MRIAFSCPMRSSVPAVAAVVTPTATSNAATVAGGGQILCASCISALRKKIRPDARPGRSSAVSVKSSVAAGAEQLHQHHEQVDEVEIETQCPHNRLLAARLVIVALVIHLLDLLRVTCRQTGEDDDADHRDRELQRRRA